MLAGTLEEPIDFHLFDDDRIEDTNLATTPYLTHQLGSPKTHALAEMLFRKGVRAIAHHITVSRPSEIMRLSVSDRLLIVDTFDNRESRLMTSPQIDPVKDWVLTLHSGVSEARTGSVLWDAWWKSPPPGGFARGENPICTHMLGATIIQLTAAYTALALRTLLTESKLVNYPLILETGEVVN
jgi:hypothetical protein